MSKKQSKESSNQFWKSVERLNNRYLTVRNAVALTFFFLALMILSPLNAYSDLAKFFLIVYAIIVATLAVLLIVEFIIKTVRLQNDPKVNRYSAIVSLNSFFGLILPLIYFNLALNKIIQYARMLPYQDTIFCELRKIIIRYYEAYAIYWKIDQLIFILVVMAFALLLFGGLFEKRSNR